MSVSAIVAVDLNNAMGFRNRLLCHLPADLRFFKEVTMGSPVVMGRRTYESIGRVLPGRRNIVVTRNADFRVPGGEVCHSADAALRMALTPPPEAHGDNNVFVIGGAEIFKALWPQLDRIYRTVIQHRFDADTWFPPLDPHEFRRSWDECHDADEKNPYAFCFERWERISRAQE